MRGGPGRAGRKARGVKNLEPEEVADAIAEALETGRFEVWVPRSTKAINTMMGFVPRRGREAIARGFKADKILAEPNQAERAAYEERAAKTPPSQEASAAKGAGEESGAEKVSAKD